MERITLHSYNNGTSFFCNQEWQLHPIQSSMCLLFSALVTKLATKTISHILTLCILQYCYFMYTAIVWSFKAGKWVETTWINLKVKSSKNFTLFGENTSISSILDFSYHFSSLFITCRVLGPTRWLEMLFNATSVFSILWHFTRHKMLPNISQKLQSWLKYLYVESKALNFEDFDITCISVNLSLDQYKI